MLRVRRAVGARVLLDIGAGGRAGRARRRAQRALELVGVELAGAQPQRARRVVAAQRHLGVDDVGEARLPLAARGERQPGHWG